MTPNQQSDETRRSKASLKARTRVYLLTPGGISRYRIERIILNQKRGKVKQESL